MLTLQEFFVKERTGMFKTSNTYDILNPSTQEPIGVAQEKPSKLLRMILNEKAPTTIEVRDTKEALVFTIERPMALFGRPKIKVVDANKKELGYFVSKRFAIGGGFHVYAPDGKHIAEVKGSWKAKEFQMLTPEQKEIGKVSKKFAGMAKEFFTSADNYLVSLTGEAPDDDTKKLLLAAALTIDMVFKE